MSNLHRLSAVVPGFGVNTTQPGEERLKLIVNRSYLGGWNASLMDGDRTMFVSAETYEEVVSWALKHLTR